MRVAWGFNEEGERVLLSVMLGMRESHEDRLELGRDLIARGLGPPLFVVADGAPGLIKGGQTVLHQCDRPLPGKTSCLTLVWAVLDLDITHAKNGVRFSQLERNTSAGPGTPEASQQPTRR